MLLDHDLSPGLDLRVYHRDRRDPALLESMGLLNRQKKLLGLWFLIESDLWSSS